MTRPLAAVVLIVTLAGCSGRPPASEPAAVWVRDVAPFPVTDLAGATVAEPFLGGFNAPRPQFVDIDADGDQDLFVQEDTGRLRFFEQVDGTYRWRTDRYASLDIGEWYRFADLDADGDADLLAEWRYSFVRVFRNVGTASQARFEAVGDTLRDAHGTPIFSDRQNIPNVTDIDADGLPDLFIGRVTGTVSRYESVGPDPAGLPLFALVTDRFEDIEIIGQAMSRHGANTLTFGDVDADGDMDLFWGDYFEPGLLLIRNRGSDRVPSMRGEPVPFPPETPLRTSGYNAPAVADVDGDGDLDVAVGVLGGAFNANTSIVDNLYLLLHGPDGGFETASHRLVKTVDVGSDSVPRVADLDGDGDLDVIVANKIEPDDQQVGRVYLYENTGSATGPALVARGPIPLASRFHQTPAFGDLDGDGDMDAVVGSWNRDLALFRNEDGRFVLEDAAFLQLTRGSNSTPFLGDLDGDGDLDLLVGEASGTLNYFVNEGSVQEPHFVPVSDTYADIDVGRRSVPVLHDDDGDGDLDLFVGTELNGILRYENAGTQRAPRFRENGAVTIDAPLLSAPAFGDLDGDGVDELLVGGVGGGILFFRQFR